MRGDVRLFRIGLRNLFDGGVPHVLVRVEDLSPVMETTLTDLRALCQTTLTNALAHERMTPLNKILSFCTSIRQTTSLDQVKGFIQVVQDTCDRMRILTESQIMQLQVECNRLKPKFVNLHHVTLRNYLEECLQPF